MIIPQVQTHSKLASHIVLPAMRQQGAALHPLKPPPLSAVKAYVHDTRQVFGREE